LPVSHWVLMAGVGVILWRHIRYAVALRSNHYPLRCIFFYTAGSILFALLLVRSAKQYLSGVSVRWKGRRYAVPAK
jgi:hypothetical protein